MGAFNHCGRAGRLAAPRRGDKPKGDHLAASPGSTTMLHDQLARPACWKM